MSHSQVEIPADIQALAPEQLLAIWNRWATKSVKKFETRKVGMERVTRLLADLEMTSANALDPDFRYDRQEAETECAPVSFPLVVSTVLEPGRYWVAEYISSRGAGSKSKPLPEWASAADWLRAILESVHPEKTYTSFIDTLKDAEPDYPVAMVDDRYTFSLKAVNELGEVQDVPKPVRVSASIFEEKTMAKKAKPVEKKAKHSTAGNAEFSVTGKKADLFKLLQRKNGVTVDEGCEALGWKKCGATMGRLLAAAGEAGYVTSKAKDEKTGKMRYYVKAA